MSELPGQTEAGREVQGKEEPVQRPCGRCCMVSLGNDWHLGAVLLRETGVEGMEKWVGPVLAAPWGPALSLTGVPGGFGQESVPPDTHAGATLPAA